MSATCRSCGASIRWERTANDKPIPLDPEPVADGNLALRDDGRVYSLPPSDLDSVPRYVTHFATCPNASEHRR
jgi:hypothetical protein